MKPSDKDGSTISRLILRSSSFFAAGRGAVYDRATYDRVFIKFLPIIKTQSVDERIYAEKAVSWALRQIGKRSTIESNSNGK
jgi:3-methyladenine DNA glycosylase AlkD